MADKDDSDAAFRRIVWLSVLSFLFAFSVHMFFGSTLAAFDDTILREVIIRNTYDNGAHYISGKVLIPSECYDLSTRVRHVDENTAVLVFETWEHSYRDCNHGYVARSFSVVSFLPEDVEFLATFNDAWVDVRVIE